jgi:hypothetical protein
MHIIIFYVKKYNINFKKVLVVLVPYHNRKTIKLKPFFLYYVENLSYTKAEKQYKQEKIIYFIKKI